MPQWRHRYTNLLDVRKRTEQRTFKLDFDRETNQSVVFIRFELGGRRTKRIVEIALYTTVRSSRRSVNHRRTESGEEI